METQPELDERPFLHDCGVRLRERLAAPTSPGGVEQRQMARAIVRDLLGSRQIYFNPISGVLDQLIAAAPSPGIAAATLAAIEQQLQLTYNAQSTVLVLSFARGFLQMEPGPGPHGAQPLALPLVAQQPSAQVVPAQVSAPAGLALLHQWLIVLTALGGFALIAAVTIRSLNSPVAPQQTPTASSAPVAPTPAQPSSTTPRATSLPPSSMAPPADLYDAGIAVGGQRVLLETSSLAATADPSRIRFRYRLGDQSVPSEADCSRRTWTTYPEGETHSPQSSATARMLARVCEAAVSPAPAVSSAGAAIVFDPPSNIRVTPNGAILCSVTSRVSIPIQGRVGDWYRTDTCGSPGYIHRGQISF